MNTADTYITQPAAERVLAENISFDDFLRQYDGQRVEWHAGKVVQAVTNNEQHQRILGFLYRLLSFYLELSERGDVYLAGLPMYIREDVSAREPDLMVILQANTSRIKDRYLQGPADVAVEIVSPGSTTLDRGVKLMEYEAFGVPEYWLIDPLRSEVSFYHLPPGENSHYQRLERASDGYLASQVLPEFRLKPGVLWQEPLPDGLAILEMAKAMLL
jgi:Uma2 family endonuclease